MPLIEIIQPNQLPAIASRKGASDPVVVQQVSAIITNVIQSGDAALLDYTLRFDKVQTQSIAVPAKKLRDAENRMPASTRGVIQKAVINIRHFHQSQLAKSWQKTDETGTVLGEVVNALDRVGIYIPGGKAFYPSSLIMNVVPAQIAGVPSIAVVSPPGDDGLPHELVLGVCQLLGIEEVYAVGGAQAVAALAYGTETIAPVCKVTGPGNQYVAEAKRQVFGVVGIDSVAGPSEILILHDDQRVPVEYLVRDLLTQAEHDEEAGAWLLTTSEKTALNVQDRIEKLVPELPRSRIITASLQNRGRIVLLQSVEEGIEIVNRIAPEHLEVLITDESKIETIRNAGAMFIGQWSTETVGDYFAGPNHTIPTDGAARYGSPLSVRDFQKHTSLIRYSKRRLEQEGEIIAQFAELEGLHAHAAAVRERFNQD